MEIINFVDRLMVLCFKVSSAVHAWDLFMISQQWAAVISSISYLFSVPITEQCFRYCALYFRAMCISV